MARLVLDIKEATKAEIEKQANKSDKTLKDFVLGKIGIKDE